MSRVIAIGDLNASLEVLQKILRGLRVINKQGAWIARNTHLVQLGDIFNRGGGARAALELLLRLQKEAPTRGSKVTIVLANHEVMTAMGNEAYSGEEEYLAFATDAQRRAWPRKVQAAMRKLYHDHEEEGPILPLAPRLDAWKALNAPGRSAMRRMLGPRGKLGRPIRKFPVVVKLGDTLFSHSALMPKWARLGIEGLNEEALHAWSKAPAFYGQLPAQSVLRHTDGPLWNRTLVMKESAKTRQQLSRSLKLLEAKRMVVGHTMTSHLGGKDGRIHTCQRGRIICIDVALGRNPDSCAALVIDKKGGQEWTPKRRRKLW